MGKARKRPGTYAARALPDVSPFLTAVRGQFVSPGGRWASGLGLIVSLMIRASERANLRRVRIPRGTRAERRMLSRRGKKPTASFLKSSVGPVVCCCCCRESCVQLQTATGCNYPRRRQQHKREAVAKESTCIYVFPTSIRNNCAACSLGSTFDNYAMCCKWPHFPRPRTLLEEAGCMPSCAFLRSVFPRDFRRV